MPSSNQRSSSTRSSRRTQTDDQSHSSRSSSVPDRQFIIILTNNPQLLRLTPTFQPQIGQQIQATIQIRNVPMNNGTVTNNNNREQILNNLLRVELREATRDYLSRTRRSYPIHYVFNMSDIETQQP